jgi:hypothetical protein
MILRRALILIKNLINWFKVVNQLRSKRKALSINPQRIIDSVERTSLRSNAAANLVNQNALYAAKFRELLQVSKNFALPRIGRLGDGGYLIPDLKYGNLISIGVGKETSFERDKFLSETKIVMFDHTVAQPPNLPKNISFHRMGVGKQSEKNLLDFNKIIRISDIDEQAINLLKVDIEGAEYEVFQNSKFSAFTVIVIEIHWLEKIFYSENIHKLRILLDTLLREHEIIHVHANNWRHLFNIGPIVLPDVVELTLMNKNQTHLLKRDSLNANQDFPCQEGFPEIWPPVL